jgi:hypothetical protein
LIYDNITINARALFFRAKKKDKKEKKKEIRNGYVIIAKSAVANKNIAKRLGSR